MVTLEVNGKPLVMEIDTGAPYSIISGATHKRLWPQKRLIPTCTTVKLRTYSGEPLARSRAGLKVHVISLRNSGFLYWTCFLGCSEYAWLRSSPDSMHRAITNLFVKDLP